MGRDSTQGAEQSMSVGTVNVTITDSTIKPLENNAFGFDVNYQGAAVYMGGATGKLVDYDASNKTRRGRRHAHPAQYEA